MTRKRTFIMGMLVNFFALGILIYFYRALPEVLVTHFDFNNMPDGFMKKSYFVVLFPLFFFTLYGMTYFTTSKDPKQYNHGKLPYTLSIIFLPIFHLVITFVLVYYNLGYHFDVGTFVGSAVAILFMVLGNYLPKIKNNYTIGIKVPWTLASDEVWNKTHRLAGYLWLFGGMINLLVILFFRSYASFILPIVFSAMIFVPVLYAYLCYQKLENKN